MLADVENAALSNAANQVLRTVLAVHELDGQGTQLVVLVDSKVM